MIGITLYKANWKNKLQSSVPRKTNIEIWDWKKTLEKKEEED
jgi:hypothetical protein